MSSKSAEDKFRATAFPKNDVTESSFASLIPR